MSATENQLKVTTAVAAGGSLVRLEGVIDQTLDAQLFGRSGGVVLLDLTGVHRITSYGVREWIKVLKDLPKDYLGFVNARPALVSQFNMVVRFDCSGELLSFYAPYVCPKCDKEIEELMDVRQQFDQILRLEPPTVKCPECQTEAEFDDSPSGYFAYVARKGKPHAPPLVDALVDGSAPVAANPVLNVTKEVHGTVTLVRLSGALDRNAHFKRLADGLEANVVFSMEHIKEADEEGLKRLGAVLSAEGPNFYLCRLSPAMAEKLRDHPEAKGPATILSARLRMTCHYCKSKRFSDIAIPEREALEQHGITPCDECGRDMEPDPTQFAVIRTLPLAKAPQELESYARSRLASVDESDRRSGEIFGRYRLIRRIGFGGMGEVSLARQTGVGGFQKLVVLKRLLPAFTSNREMVELFLQEARLAARVSHPNVVQIFDLGQEGDGYFIAMEYVRGLDLMHVLRASTKTQRMIPFELAAHIVAGICAGLHAAHTWTDHDGNVLGLVHRDVSPHNVLVSFSGHIKVTDFGVAKTLASAEHSNSDQIKGKLPYTAPERLDPRLGTTDARSDIFSVGVVLYQALTLEHPFKRESDLATFKAILDGVPPPLRLKRPDAPQLLLDIIERSLERDPNARYPTAFAMQEDLEKLISELRRPVGAHVLAEWLKEMNFREIVLPLAEEEEHTPSLTAEITKPAR